MCKLSEVRKISNSLHLCVLMHSLVMCVRMCMCVVTGDSRSIAKCSISNVVYSISNAVESRSSADRQAFTSTSSWTGHSTAELATRSIVLEPFVGPVEVIVIACPQRCVHGTSMHVDIAALLRLIGRRQLGCVGIINPLHRVLAVIQHKVGDVILRCAGGNQKALSCQQSIHPVQRSETLYHTIYHTAYAKWVARFAERGMVQG